jgi:flagellar biosynthesis protein FlhG
MSTTACWQVLRHLETVIRDFDHLVFDAGSCTAAAETLWSAADQVVVVTTPDQLAVTDAYGLVKCMANRSSPTASIGFAINRYHDKQNALDIQHRLIRSCEQFLAVQAHPVGCIPADKLWEVAVNEARSIACTNPQAPGAVAIHEMAQRLASGAESTFDLNPVMAN